MLIKRKISVGRLRVLKMLLLMEIHVVAFHVDSLCTERRNLTLQERREHQLARLSSFLASGLSHGKFVSTLFQKRKQSSVAGSGVGRESDFRFHVSCLLQLVDKDSMRIHSSNIIPNLLFKKEIRGLHSIDPNIQSFIQSSPSTNSKPHPTLHP